MRRYLLCLGMGLSFWLLANSACLVAQFPGRPGPDPRAYRHFLRSRSPYRTYSTATPGRVTEYQDPYTYYRREVGPGYLNHRITPRGFEGYHQVPSYSEQIERPFSGNSYYVPGYGYRFYAPRPFLPPPYER